LRKRTTTRSKFWRRTTPTSSTRSGGDWCKDCRAQLPDFGAALETADVPDSHIQSFEVDQDKQGPKVEEYDIERIPTVVAERRGEEIARFVESESAPIAVYLADQIAAELGDPTA
jgi:thioredoxin 1